MGTLRHEPGERWVFRTFPSYREAHQRPVLGQVFEDDLERVWQSRLRLPPFFANLLPEGPLRELLARHVGVHPDREGFLLARLGEDLPGAIEAVPEEGEELPRGAPKLDESGAAGPEDDRAGALKFSLAGVQLKLSALEDERGLTVPASGSGGDWIVKLPLDRHPELPRIELSMLAWARESGLEVPDHRLVRVEEIEGLPADWPVQEGEALAVRRYDRAPGGRRIHQEDFAQVLNLYPERKYEEANCEVLGRVLLALTGDDGLLELVRRLVFVVLSGNGDAHLKNWSLIYPDGHTPRLSPFYDAVFTRAFLPEDRLALNLAGEKDFYRIDSESFERFARKVRADPVAVAHEAREAGERIRATWRKIRRDLPLDEEVRELLDDHLDRAPL